MRIFMLISFVALLFLVIAARLFQLQIIKGKEYTDLANTQHYGAIDLPAKRGEILLGEVAADFVDDLKGAEELAAAERPVHHHGDAGVDLFSTIDHTLQPGARVLVPTGLKMAIPEGYEGQVRPRSGLAARDGVTVLNAPGTVDSDYRGEVKVILVNHGREPISFARGERIAQLVVAPVARAELVLVEELGGSDRGHGGFGSTGKH